LHTLIRKKLLEKDQEKGTDMADLSFTLFPYSYFMSQPLSFDHKVTLTQFLEDTPTEVERMLLQKKAESLSGVTFKNSRTADFRLEDLSF